MQVTAHEMLVEGDFQGSGQNHNGRADGVDPYNDVRGFLRPVATTGSQPIVELGLGELGYRFPLGPIALVDLVSLHDGVCITCHEQVPDL